MVYAIVRKILHITSYYIIHTVKHSVLMWRLLIDFILRVRTGLMSTVSRDVGRLHAAAEATDDDDDDDGPS